MTLNFWPNLLRYLSRLYDTRILHFYAAGATSVFLHIAVAWLLTTHVFGESRYYIGYFIGMGVAWMAAFLMQAYLTFQVSDNLLGRLSGFVASSIATNVLQALLVTSLTSYFGSNYYLTVMTGSILVVSLASFLTYKFWVFGKIRVGQP